MRSLFSATSSYTDEQSTRIPCSHPLRGLGRSLHRCLGPSSRTADEPTDVIGVPADQAPAKVALAINGTDGQSDGGIHSEPVRLTHEFQASGYEVVWSVPRPDAPQASRRTAGVRQMVGTVDPPSSTGVVDNKLPPSTNPAGGSPFACLVASERRTDGDASFVKVPCEHCSTSFWCQGNQTDLRCNKCRIRPERVATCGICLEQKLVFHDFGSQASTQHHTGGCNGRNFCQSCMQRHCSVELDIGDGVSCRCPHPECRATLTHEELRKISKGFADHLEARQQQLKRAKELAERQAKLDALADRLDSPEGDELLQWASSGAAQLCPHCLVFVERSSGCRHMTCRCRGQFCFSCGGEWPCNKFRCTDTTKPNGCTAILDSLAKKRREKRAQRRYAFLMASRCGDECAASRLPADALRIVVERIE